MVMNKITIIGSGALGSALANILVDSSKENDVLIYGIDNVELKDLEQGKNVKYFGNDILLNKFKTTNDLNIALKDCQYLIIAIPSTMMNSVIESVLKIINHPILIINGSKGFYPDSLDPLHVGIENKVKNNKNIRGVISISGPSFAIEMVKKSLTTIAAIGHDKQLIKEVQQLFKTNYFKLYGQSDVIGAEVGAIYKNILAIGAGIITQMNYKINTLASYLTRGMKEMSVFNKFMGGNENTIYGLTGLGDLILTSTDPNSRNFTYGMNFVKGIKDTKKITIEGIKGLEIVNNIRVKNNLYLPIVAALYNIIYENKSIKEEINKLFNTEIKDEN